MRTNIIRIGNSQGVRIPKILLEQSRLGTEVELVVENEMIVIRSAARPREGWGEKFRLMSEGGDDKMIDEELSGQTEWDKDEWEW
ncbi:MAG TPA: AbrB/MazE/SpoVT family DNA-binding domain-containing protein [Geomonas sp.]